MFVLSSESPKIILEKISKKKKKRKDNYLLFL